ncbi:MAG: polymerase sigma-70 factor, subfamily [Frankiales bacterium]|nr:polymerase sigma-70 factor, subfamily [Frankiales bacterium]MDX6272801.1 polymerase sigma-70 factor, subfamily [Frankiales bacterium]
MSSAHDLPSTISPEVAPGGPHLSLVPPLVDDAAAPFDLDLALAEAGPRLQRYATRRLGSSHEAEEVVQEALLRAYQHRSSFATVDDLMAWSTVVTGRLVIDRVRVRGRSVTVADVPEQTRIGRDTADVVVARDEARLALDALECMPTRQAAVLWAREVEGQSYDEIAERYGLTEPTVRSLLHRARKTLRREYAARGGTLPVGGLIVLAPWLKSLSGLGKLRAAVRKAALSGAALSIAGLSAISAIGLSPTGPQGAPPAATAAVPVVTMPRTVSTVVVTPTVHRAAAAHAAVPAAKGHTTLDAVDQLPPICPTDTDVSAGCSHAGKYKIYIGPPLPENPTGIRRVGVYVDAVDCRTLPQVPTTQCAPSAP